MKKLVRPQRGRMVAGVAEGISQYLGVDVTVIRLIIVLITIFSGIFPGALLYLLAWILVPEEK